ncbi:MAG: DNA polymerase III subunit delta [Brevinema sp.]
MKSVILLGGENPVFIKETLHKILDPIPEMDKTIYYGDELDLDTFFSDLMTGSLFSAQRTIVVRQAELAKGDFEKNLLSYLNQPSDSVCLILEYHKIPAKVLSAVDKLGNTIAETHVFKKAWANDQKNYLQRKFSEKGIAIQATAIQLLIEMAGDDIEELSGMVERLFSYLGDQRTVSEEQIRFVLERAQNGSIFDLIDAIFQRNTQKALETFQDLQYAGESFPAINAMLLRATRIMWAVKTSRNGQIPQGFAVSPYEWNKYLGMAKNVNLKFLSGCLETISQIEFESKTKPEIFAQTTFESFLCTLN